MHTAVKIAPRYDGPVLHVGDASRSVSVCQALLSPERKAGFVAEQAAQYERLRSQHASRAGPDIIALAQARANATPLDWHGYHPPRPSFVGRRDLIALDLAQIAGYIDWGPFFKTWELTGPYPALLDDPVVGVQARRVFDDARRMLERLIAGRWLTANAALGFYPANAEGEDIVLYRDESRHARLFTWYGLRQQTRKPVIDGRPRPNRALADFVGPAGVADYLGVFAVTAGLGIEAREAQFAREHDDYGSILLKSLADRLAEAAAEMLHERVRRDLWGYAPDERLDPAQLVAEKYQGIRPAPGYPACPEHSVKHEMFEALQAGRIGMHLTENLAMIPASSVSGFYFSHPQARYFNVGPIGRDQLADHARRRGIDAAQLERMLAPNLAS